MPYRLALFLFVVVVVFLRRVIGRGSQKEHSMSRKAAGNYGLYLLVEVRKPSCLEGFLKEDGLGW